MEELVVRDARPEDAHEIGRIHVETWQAAYRGQIPDEYLDGLSIESRVEAWQRTLSEGDLEWPEMEVWVAERDGRVIGFCGAGPGRDGDASEDVGEVYAIYVDSEHWDSGAGAALMNHAVEALRGRFRVATLWVLDTNERARRFYERGGWKADGTEKKDDARGFTLNEVRYRISL